MTESSILPITTRRLFLRDFVHTDIKAVVKIASNPAFTGYRQFSRDNVTEDVMRFITDAIKWQQPDQKLGVREIWRLAVCLQSDQSLIGYTSLWGWSGKTDENPELGYFLDPDYQSLGYITEASKALIDFFQSQNPDKPVYSMAHPENIPSQNVLRRLGFKVTGLILRESHGVKEPRITYKLDALIS